MVKPGLRKLYLPVNVFRFRSGKTARTLSFDRSYLLHIRMGRRNPANPAASIRTVYGRKRKRGAMAAVQANNAMKRAKRILEEVGG